MFMQALYVVSVRQMVVHKVLYADSFRVYVPRAINTVDVTIQNGSVLDHFYTVYSRILS